VVVNDSSVANRDDARAQIGWMVLLTTDTGTDYPAANDCVLLQYSSNASRKVCRSSFAGELNGNVEGAEAAEAIQYQIWEIMPDTAPIPIDVFTDSHSVFDGSKSNKRPDSKTAWIDIQWLRIELVDKRLRSLQWIPSEWNFADGLTKWFGREIPPSMYQLFSQVYFEDWVQPQRIAKAAAHTAHGRCVAQGQSAYATAFAAADVCVPHPADYLL